MGFIKIDSVGKRYERNCKGEKRSLWALKNLSFSAKEGDFVSIVGPFGSGKTTFLNLLGGITGDYEGKIEIKGKSPEWARINRRIGYCFQKPNLLPWRTVLDNVLLPLEIAGLKDRKRAFQLLKMVGLKDCSNLFPYELSGGMQRLVSITRSLVLDPNVLLLDEPFSSIDEINREKMHLELLEIHKKTKKTTLMVTHSLKEAIYLSNQVIVFSPRPGRVKKIFDIRLPNRRQSIIYSPKFINYVKDIRAELKNGQVSN